MALSPWPEDGEELEAALNALWWHASKGTWLPATAAQRTRENADAALNQAGMAAAVMVEREAPGAPQAIKDEAVIRFASYLVQSLPGTISQERLGPKDVEHVVNHAPMFRNCGAKGLLAPWKIRRAGAIG